MTRIGIGDQVKVLRDLPEGVQAGEVGYTSDVRRSQARVWIQRQRKYVWIWEDDLALLARYVPRGWQAGNFGL